MQDKKILAILTPDSDDAVINSFITSFAKGKNIDITLCSVHSDTSPAEQCDEVLDRVTSTCTKQSIPLHIIETHSDAATAMRKRAAFVDLVLVSKEILCAMALRDDLPTDSGAIIALPRNFKTLTNVILMFDGSSASLRGIKEFFQAFSHYTRDMDVTLLSIDSGKESIRRKSEALLIEYLRQYSSDVGVLKVQPPLSDRHLRAVCHKKSPIVTGPLEYLIGQHSEEAAFKPFYDDTSTLFIPATAS